MSQTVPTTDCTLQFESQVNGAINAGDIDIMHFISDGSIVSWIDFQGFPGGNLKQGGGGGGGNKVFINGVEVDNPNFQNGTGISLNVSGDNVTVNNTGVTSVNGNTGAVTINVEPANVPWQDIQKYGAIPILQGNATTTTATTTAGFPTVSVASPIFTNGSGICIWKAGNPTTQSTPAAPTVTMSGVTGSQVLNYQIVGYDRLGGLTAASGIGSISNAPTIFSLNPVPISSISLTTNVVTVNFSSPLNSTVTSGMTLHITGVTGAGLGWNGIFQIASVISTSQVTYNLVGSNATGAVSGAQGRVSNVQLIETISRNSSGVISLTTGSTHNWTVNSRVIIENVTPTDLNGVYTIQTASGNSATTFPTANLNAETGTVSTVAFESTATVYEHTTIACPALSGTTLGYYIYSDSPNPGGALTLIGKTLSQESHFLDWGPALASGYRAPAYVPTAPPVAPQNQMFATTVLLGGGSNFLVLNANVPTSVSGTTASIDHGPNLLQALAVGPCVLTPGALQTAASLYNYVFNSPITLPAQSYVTVATSTFINETWTCTNNSVTITAPFNSPAAQTPSFGLQSYVPIGGLGNPIFLGRNSFNLSQVIMNTACNGQNQVMVVGSYISITNCAFEAGPNTTSTPLIFNGGTSSVHLENNTYSGSGLFGVNGPIPGQGFQVPFLLPMVSFRASDNPLYAGIPPNQIVFHGLHTFNARGILFDGTFFTAGTAFQYDIGDSLWMQGPAFPTLTFTGATYSGIRLKGILNDSEPTAILGVFANLEDVQMDNYQQGESQSLTTGNAIKGFRVTGLIGTQTQSTSVIQEAIGTTNIAGVTGAGQAASLYSQPIVLQTNGALVQKVSIPAPTLSISGAGTFSAGTLTVQLSYLGWDGNETAIGAVSTIVVNGSQGISVSFSVPSGFQGVRIYINQRRQQFLYTTSPQTFSSIFGGDPFAALDSTGLPCIANGIIVTPTLIMPSGVNKLTVVAPTLTGNRALTYADGPQSTVVATSLTTTAGGTPYTVALQGATSNSHISITATNATAAADMPNVYVSSKNTNSVTIVTSTTAGETFDIVATII